MKILDGINDFKERGTSIRSRVDIIEQNEKSNRYFFNKEKESFDKKTVEQPKIDNDYISDSSQILNEFRRYYSNLYSSRSLGLETLLLHTALEKRTRTVNK